MFEEKMPEPIKSERETKVIFPEHRNEEKGKEGVNQTIKNTYDKIRVSKQELRFVMTSLLEKSDDPNLYYSVETPTEEKYSFSGDGEYNFIFIIK